jgi:hypothetical protein
MNTTETRVTVLTSAALGIAAVLALIFGATSSAAGGTNVRIVS